MTIRYMSRAQRRARLDDDAKWMEREMGGGLLDEEPWQRQPADPTVEHVVTFERRLETAGTQERATCTCGFVRGWEFPGEVDPAARFHREAVREAKIAHGLDSLPVPLIERGVSTAGTLYRWLCTGCSKKGEWIPSEAIAAVGSTLHGRDCEVEERRRAGHTLPRHARAPGR